MVLHLELSIELTAVRVQQCGGVFCIVVLCALLFRWFGNLSYCA